MVACLGQTQSSFWGGRGLIGDLEAALADLAHLEAHRQPPCFTSQLNGSILCFPQRRSSYFKKKIYKTVQEFNHIFLGPTFVLKSVQEVKGEGNKELHLSPTKEHYCQLILYLQAHLSLVYLTEYFQNQNDTNMKCSKSILAKKSFTQVLIILHCAACDKYHQSPLSPLYSTFQNFHPPLIALQFDSQCQWSLI